MNPLKTLAVAALLIAILSLKLFAQVPVTWGEPEELGDELALLESHMLPDGRMYTIETRQFFNLSVRVNLYDVNRKRTGHKQLKFPKQDKMWGVAGALHQYITLNGKHYFITDEPMPGKGSISLLAWEFKPESLTIADAPIVLAKTKGAGLFRQGRFHYVFNRNHSRLYVVEMPGQEKNETEKWVIREFDGALSMVNERIATLPYEASKFHVTGVDLDEKGNLVVACMLYEKGGPLAEIFSSEYTHLYAFLSAGSTEVKVAPISFDGKVPHQISHILDEDAGTVYIYGFFSKSRTDLAEGIFECNLSFEAEILSKKLHPFPQEVVQNMQRIDKLREKSEVQYLTMRSVSINADGSRQFIAEQRLIRNVVYIYNDYSENSTLHFASNNILVVKLYPDESMNWYSWIGKKQHSVNDGGRFLSFRHQVLPDGSIRILYNDAPENLLNSSGDAEKMNNKNFSTVLATVSHEGKVTKTKLFDTDEVGHRLLISSIEFTSDEVFVLAVAKKTFRQGIVDLRALN